MIYFMCMKCFVCVCVRVTHVYQQRSEERVGSPETGVMHGYEPPSVCWELKLGSLQE